MIPHTPLILVLCMIVQLPAALSAAETDTKPLSNQLAILGPNNYRLVDVFIADETPRPTPVDAPKLRLRQGSVQPHPRFRTGTPTTFSKAIVHDEALIIEAVNLRNDRQYVLRLTCWDGDAPERKLSIQIRNPTSKLEPQTILPPTLCAAWHADKATSMRLSLPLPPGPAPLNRFYITLKCEAGPDIAISEIRLMESTDSFPQDEATRRRRVLIVTGDDYPGHRWRQTAPALAAILRADPRMEVTICESPMILASSLLGHYDAIVLHYINWSGPDPGAAVHRGLTRFVTRGGGLVVVHFGCGAFREWNDYGQVIGRVWDPDLRGHDPYGRFTVQITNPPHPVTRSLNDFETDDELYTCLTGDADIQVLATATSKVDQLDYPMAFTRTYQQGRVFHCTLGHDANAFTAPGTQALYRRAAAWAANLSPDVNSQPQGKQP